MNTWALQEARWRTQAKQRHRIFEKFTMSCISNTITDKKFSKWFCKTDTRQSIITRSKKMQFKYVYTRTKAFANSTIPQKVTLANKLGLKNKVNSLKINSGQIIVI